MTDLSNVHHIVVWIESPTGVEMSLGLEGPIASLYQAERVAKVYRRLYRIKDTAAHRDPAWTRIGILSIPPTESTSTAVLQREAIDGVISNLEARILRLLLPKEPLDD